MRAPALGEAITQLPWLSPCAGSLVALARAPAARAWDELRIDPGAVLLLAAHGSNGGGAPNAPFFQNILETEIIETALRHLNAGGHADWSLPGPRCVYRCSLAIAGTARHLAERSGRSDADNAWTAGLLAPLGWFGACALCPESVLDCFEDPRSAHDAGAVQRERWGLDSAALARRLARRWGLPAWLGIVAGHLGLPAEAAESLGADADLFRLVQLAVALVQRREPSLHLEVGESPAANARALAISNRDLEEAESGPAVGLADTPSVSWEPVGSVPLLRDLLNVALENRRVAGSCLLRQVEQDVDLLHETLHAQRTAQEAALRDLKLRALAEFAAGAGHEINNPLAVISGQAQYLASHEPEPGRQRALQTITSQARRIHETLTALMQFARPPRPQKEPTDLGALVEGAVASVMDFAVQRRVQLVGPAREGDFALVADIRQIHTALVSLIRNAIEAAPVDGWTRIHIRAAAELLEVVVEDNGLGLAPAQREHLFDPFYSGRQAGRSRGLGLPTAWRLARQHGGDVRIEDHPGGTTRFILSIPRNGSAERPEASGPSPESFPIANGDAVRGPAESPRADEPMTRRVREDIPATIPLHRPAAVANS